MGTFQIEHFQAIHYAHQQIEETENFHARCKRKQSQPHQSKQISFYPLSVKFEARKSSLISPMNLLFLFLMLLMKERCFEDARTHQNMHIFGFQRMCLLLACDLKSMSGGEDEAAALHLSLPFKAILISPILLKFENIAFLPGQWNRTMTSFSLSLCLSFILTIHSISH